MEIVSNIKCIVKFFETNNVPGERYIYVSKDTIIDNHTDRFIALISFLKINTYQLIKLVLKKRVYHLFKIMKINNCIPNIISSNANNGTYVLQKNDVVYKFYFKKTDDYLELYRVLSRANAIKILEFKSNEHYTIVIMPRYCKPSQINEKKLFDLNSIINNNINKFFIQQSDLKSVGLPSNRLRELFYFYENRYINLYSEINNAVIKIQNCIVDGCFVHGDLWSENILSNLMGDIVIIDYDKFMIFFPSYDFIFYSFMKHRYIFSSSIFKMLEKIEELKILIQKSYNSIYGKSLDSTELDLSLRLIFIFKFTEHGLRNNNLDMLVDKLEVFSV